MATTKVQRIMTQPIVRDTGHRVFCCSSAILVRHVEVSDFRSMTQDTLAIWPVPTPCIECNGGGW